MVLLLVVNLPMKRLENMSFGKSNRNFDNDMKQWR